MSGVDGPDVPTNFEYMLYDTMFEWGIDPERWEKFHPNEQAMMMAYVVARRSRESYVTDWYQQKNK